MRPGRHLSARSSGGKDFGDSLLVNGAGQTLTTTAAKTQDAQHLRSAVGARDRFGLHRKPPVGWFSAPSLFSCTLSDNAKLHFRSPIMDEASRFRHEQDPVSHKDRANDAVFCCGMKNAFDA
ncbi:hypothetical protein [Pyrinomonas sp.]|uniref:hypothetical protein n=1 Tax=Pyrinomonas sp. TaxID=2080306 RepID=UPI00332DDDA7